MTMITNESRRSALSTILPRKVRRKTRIGLVAGGLGSYWP